MNIRIFPHNHELPSRKRKKANNVKCDTDDKQFVEQELVALLIQLNIDFNFFSNQKLTTSSPHTFSLEGIFF